MAGLKSGSIQYLSDCKSLVKKLTNFDEEEKNFQTCVDFAVSNLLYHSYLDVNIYAVKQKISRLYEKYFIHSDLGRARNFQLVTEKLIQIFDDKCGSKRIEGYRILSLLLNLSESTDDQQDYQKSPLPNNSNEELENFDWGSFLSEDNINIHSLSNSSSEISLSEQGSTNDFPTSEEDSLENLPDPLLRPPPRDDSGLGISPDSTSGTSQHFHVAVGHQECIPFVTKTERNPETFYPYWLLRYQKNYGSSPYNMKNLNFTRMWNEYMLNQNPFSIIEKKVVVHERNVIKEVLWMLSGVKDLYLIHWNGERFSANSGVHLCNLTSETFSVVLNYFCEYGTKKAILSDFQDTILRNKSQHCRTYQAYAWSVQEHLQKINASVSNLDKKLRRDNSIFTLLSLKKDVQSLFHEIDLIYAIHRDVLAEVSGAEEPVVVACRLLRVLWRLAHHHNLLKQKATSLKMVLRIFLKTCRPYFSFLEELIILGCFNDPHGEFIVKKDDINVTHETFWEKGFNFRPLPQDVQEDFFLKPILTDILSAGKSLEIFNMINCLLRREPFRLHAEKGDMYAKFIKVLQKSLSRSVNKKSSSAIINLHVHAISAVSLRDPLLEEEIFPSDTVTAKFFQPDINPAYKTVTQKIPDNVFSEKHKQLDRIVESLEAGSLKSLSKSVNKALETCMRFAYFPVCRQLVKVLMEDYKIVSHLAVMRKYFLMESGDLMFSFYSEVFEKMFYKEPWLDVSFLYCALQNAISDDKENAPKLCIFLDTQNPEISAKQPLSVLNALQLSYEVEWPVSLLLGSRNQIEYCQIFSFLLQIKCAKYLLDDLYCIGIYKQQLQSQFKKAYMRGEFPQKQKIHGMYILRMKLMFFVNGIHNYIMTRILHSFSVEFVEALENCGSVEELLSTHEIYLRSVRDRCLLDRKLFYFKEHILHVLNLCYALQQLWIRDTDKVKLEELQLIENRFSKYCNSLDVSFNTFLRRGTNIHLESLASTMLSGTHSFRVFTQAGS